MMPDNEEITLEDIIEAHTKMMHGEPTPKEIKEAEKKIRNALDIIINCPEKAKILSKELGLKLNPLDSEADSWSLKGLKSNRIDRVDRSFDVPFYYYHEIAIETLRQKLIEDFQNELFPYQQEGLLPHIKRIVNKRFGAESVDSEKVD